MCVYMPTCATCRRYAGRAAQTMCSSARLPCAFAHAACLLQNHKQPSTPNPVRHRPHSKLPRHARDSSHLSQGLHTPPFHGQSAALESEFVMRYVSCGNCACVYSSLPLPTAPHYACSTDNTSIPSQAAPVLVRGRQAWCWGVPSAQAAPAPVSCSVMTRDGGMRALGSKQSFFSRRSNFNTTVASDGEGSSNTTSRKPGAINLAHGIRLCNSNQQHLRGGQRGQDRPGTTARGAK
jgi:hypothetical protein